MTQDTATMLGATRPPRPRRSPATPLADNELWFSVREASDLAGLSYRLFLRAVVEGRIASRKIANGARPRIHRDTIIALRQNKPCRGK